MTIARRILAGGLLLALTATVLASETLGVGSVAPPLKVAAWMKGAPLKGFEAGKSYVVEFWATWCGPCKTTIPHITELAHKYKGKVEFVGVSVYEQGPMISSKVADFVKSMGNQMDYLVARDEDKGFMAKNWMEAAQQEGIPTAFLVHNKQILWIGHPMEIDEKLELLVKGKFDLAKEMTAAKKLAEDREIEKAMIPDFQKAEGLYELGKKKEALALVRKYRRDTLPGAMAYQVELGLMLRGECADAKALIEQLATKKSVVVFRAIASVAQIQRASLDAEKRKVTSTDAEIADLQNFAIDAALKGTAEKDMVVLYYGAAFFERAKNKDRALNLINKAIAEFPNSEYKDQPELMQKLRDTMVRISKG